MVELVQPDTAIEWESYFDLRWRALRAPWGRPPGSERDALDSASVHIMALLRGVTVAIGRLSILDQGSARIGFVAVHESYRRRRLGSTLLLELERRALLGAVGRLLVNARESAVPFYLKHRYRVVRRGQTLFETVRHSHMEKVLMTASPAPVVEERST